MRGANRSGLTLAELLVVVAILGILAGLAVPFIGRAGLEARAAEAVARLDMIRVAALEYHGEHDAWPPDAGRGTVPPGLESFLPDGFSLAPEGYVLDWDNWSGRRNGFVGVSVVTEEPELREAMVSLLGHAGTWRTGRTELSWIIEWD